MSIIGAFYEDKRQYLHNLLPLDGPFSANVEVSSACNIRCRYCYHASKQAEKTPVYNMSLEMFSMLMAQFKSFPAKLKKLVINGVGEPLCNPDFPEIIKIAKKADIAESIEFFTNGILLTHETAEAIQLRGGVDRVKISLQGLSTNKYKMVCGKNINFDELYDNISYFAEIRGNTELCIKIINIGLENDYDLFLEKFSFADKLFVEHVQPWFKEIDYSTMIDSRNNSDVKNKYGSLVHPAKVCPIPFYRLYINAKGEVFYCYSIRKPAEIYNFHDIALIDIWKGASRNNFLKYMLKEGCSANKECSTCTMMCDAAFSKYDNLDFYAQEIIKRFD